MVQESSRNNLNCFRHHLAQALDDGHSPRCLPSVQARGRYFGSLLAQMPQCHAIATTGEKATTEVCDYFNVDTIPSPNTKVALEDGLTLYRLPSSSRAYPLSFDKKVEAYKRMFEAVFGA